MVPGLRRGEDRPGSRLASAEAPLVSFRRTLNRHGLRLIQGEARPDAEATNTPAGRFAKGLDGWTRDYLSQNPGLSGTDVLAVYLRLAAALGVELGATSADVAGAVEAFFIEEYEARKGPA